MDEGCLASWGAQNEGRSRNENGSSWVAGMGEAAREVNKQLVELLTGEQPASIPRFGQGYGAACVLASIDEWGECTIGVVAAGISKLLQFG